MRSARVGSCHASCTCAAPAQWKIADGRARSSASRTAFRSSKSTASHVTLPLLAEPASLRADPRCAHACAAAPRAVSRSSKWLPANPVAPVINGTPVTRASAVPVLALVVLAVFGVFVLDRPPPPLVLAIPVHGLREPFLEAHRRLPAERFQLRRVERVAAIVSLPIGHRFHERHGFVDECEQTVRQVDVLHL